MTEYELTDMLTNSTLAGVETFGMVVTLTGAYLVASYTAGKNLTTAQAVIISLLFVVAAVVMVTSNFGYLSRGIYLADQLKAINPDHQYVMRPILRNAIAVVQVFAIITSLLFLWRIRNPAKDT